MLAMTGHIKDLTCLITDVGMYAYCQQLEAGLEPAYSATTHCLSNGRTIPRWDVNAISKVDYLECMTRKCSS